MSARLLLVVLSVIPAAEANVGMFVASLFRNLDTEQVGHVDHLVISRRRDRGTNVNVGREKRLSSYSPYTSDAYDLGPIGMCSHPQLDICDFPQGYTVPEFVARNIHNYNDALNRVVNVASTLDGSDCSDALTDFMCNQLITPRCVSNTTVRYPSREALRKCEDILSRCPRLRSRENNFCTLVNDAQPTGLYSLTTCRIPSVSGCWSTRPSPDWLVAEMEYRAIKFPFSVVIEEVGLDGSCKENYMKFACTRPTCSSDGRLQGYRTETQCNSFLDCLSDPTVRETVKTELQCDHMDSLHRPSPRAGQSRKSSAGGISGIVVAASVLLIVLV